MKAFSFEFFNGYTVESPLMDTSLQQTPPNNGQIFLFEIFHLMMLYSEILLNVSSMDIET